MSYKYLWIILNIYVYYGYIMNIMVTFQQQLS
jgi:hypothetical protein